MYIRTSRAVHWCIRELSVLCLLCVFVYEVRLGVFLDGLIVISPYVHISFVIFTV